MVVRVGCTTEGKARQRRDTLRAGLRERNNNRGGRRQGRGHGQAADTAIVDTDFAAGAAGEVAG